MPSRVSLDPNQTPPKHTHPGVKEITTSDPAWRFWHPASCTQVCLWASLLQDSYQVGWQLWCGISLAFEVMHKSRAQVLVS